MRKKCFTAALAILLMATSVGFAQRGLVLHELQIRNELGQIITDITSITICTSATTSAATIYADPMLATAVTNPITTVSANTTLTQATGSCYWYGPDGYDVTLISTRYGTIHLKGYNASTGTIVMPTYWAASQAQVSTDAQNFTLGTDSDWVINGGGTANLLKFTPASDGSVFRVGLADGSKSSTLQWYTDSGLGLFIDESGNTLDILGLVLNVNVSNNTAVNLATGTSTGTVTIGGTGTQSIAIGNAAGAKTVALGSVTGASATTINGGTADVTITSADDIFLVTNTGAGDVISFINTAGTSNSAVILRSTAGGVNIDAAAALDVDIAGGQVLISSKDDAASAIALTTNVGTSETLVLTNTLGTSESAITLLSSAGGVNIDAALLKDVAVDGGQVLITGKDAVANQVYIQATGTVAGNGINLATTNGGIVLTAGNATNGDITFTAGDALLNSVTGNMTSTVGGNWAMNATGTAAVTSSDWGISTAGAATKMASVGFDSLSVVYCDTITVTTAQISGLYGAPKELVAAPGAHNAIQFLGATCVVDYDTGDWAADSNNLTIKYVDGSGTAASGTLSQNGLLSSGADAVGTFIPVALAAGAKTLTENRALVLCKATGNATVEASGATVMRVKVFYAIHPTGF